jgi:SulP family sulfate permease
MVPKRPRRRARRHGRRPRPDPEAIAFSIIAGVDPKVGLYASFCIAVVTAFAGGRPAMISAATGAMALVMVGLVRDHGLQYLLAA